MMQDSQDYWIWDFRSEPEKDKDIHDSEFAGFDLTWDFRSEPEKKTKKSMTWDLI